MKRIIFGFFLLFLFLINTLFAQQATPVINGWGIEETTIGGANPPPVLISRNNSTLRFYLEINSSTIIKPTVVYIGINAFTLLEEKFDKNNFKKGEYPFLLSSPQNKIIQFTLSDSSKITCNIKIKKLIKSNAAVFVYLFKGKQYLVPIKTFIQTIIELQ